jgi:hypothetical protein
MAQVEQIEESNRSRLSRFASVAESRSHPVLWEVLLLLAGFLIRLWHASGTFLNPDEALHFMMANKTSWGLAYRASLSLAHPPLLVFVLHAWRELGTSELWLRMPSVLAGTVFCWLTFRWLRTLFPDTVAWIGFVFVLFLPSSIELSSEVRQYALLLAFAIGAACLLERALANNSVWAMLGSGVCLWLALLSHYSAFLFAAVLGIYAIVRMLHQHPKLKVLAAWEFGQVVASWICYFLYVTHLAALKHTGSGMAQGWEYYLSRSYFDPARGNVLSFTLGRTGGVFQYVFGQAVVGDLACVVFLLRAAWILRKRIEPERMKTGILILLPFVLTWGLAMLHVYPYGGTRHSAYLLPFAIAGVSACLAYLARDRPAWGVCAALSITLLCNVFATHRAPYMSRTEQSSGNMTAATKFIREQIPASEPIFADYQSSLLLTHYLCEQKPVTISRAVAGFLTFDCGGHRVITTDWNTYLFDGGNFAAQWQSMQSKYNLPPGSKVWVTQMGWSTHLAEEVRGPNVSPRYFGNRIEVFDLITGPGPADYGAVPKS